MPTQTLDYAVVIPAFNAGRTLRDAINSILAQTLRPSTIVVVDDGSDDDTAAIAATFSSVTLVRQDHRGPAIATDRGLLAITSDIVAGLDADDIWFPEKAERQLVALGGEPGLDAVFCRAVNFQHGGSPDPCGPARDLWGRSAMMIRRSAAQKIGPVFMDLDARAPGEMIRWLDAGRRQGLRFQMMQETLLGRRIIEGSLSARRDPAALLPMLRARMRRHDRESG